MKEITVVAENTNSFLPSEAEETSQARSRSASTFPLLLPLPRTALPWLVKTLPEAISIIGMVDSLRAKIIGRRNDDDEHKIV